MKYTLLYLVIVLATFFYSCGPMCENAVEFKEPQPAFKSEEKEFSKKYFGKYLSNADSSILQISENWITRFNTIIYGESQKKLVKDSSVMFNGSTIRIDGKFHNFYMKKDSIFIKYEVTDTLFTKSEFAVLKYFKSSFFLNKRSPCGGWLTYRLYFNDKGVLILKELKIEKDKIEQIEEIKTNNDTSVTYLVHPTRREFKRNFIKNATDDGEHFLRIK